MYTQSVSNSEVVKYENFLGGSDSDLILSYQKTELLCMILDLTPSWWLKYPETTMTNFIDTIIAFSSIFLTFSSKKELAIIGVVPEKSAYIYTTDMKPGDITSSITSSKNHYLQFVEQKIRENIIQLISESSSIVNYVNLSGGFIKSLCYFKRILKIHNSQTNQSDFHGRFIVVRSGLVDSSASFMSMMNGVFTAQKLGICIDVCILSPEESGSVVNSNVNSVNHSHDLDKANILRQSVDMTGGIYLTIGKMRDLLQYFVTLYLTDIDDRQFLTMINNSSVDIDFRASCFCHGTLVSVGYVCSLCLAVFCRYSSLCACCWALFNDKKIVIAAE